MAGLSDITTTHSLVERDDTVRDCINAILARQHVLMIGLPGIAKSLIAKTLAESIKGATVFETELNPYTTPTALFGPMDLAALESGTYSYNTGGMLPDADFAIINEVFNAQGATLQSLNGTLNERQFINGGEVMDLPLKTVFATTNRMPSLVDYGSTYDRFLVRCHVKPIQERCNFVEFIMNTNDASRSRKTTEVMDMETLCKAQSEVQDVKVTLECAEALGEIRYALQTGRDSNGNDIPGFGGNTSGPRKTGPRDNFHFDETLVPSDRRWEQCVELARARAFLSQRRDENGNRYMVPSDLLAIICALWVYPEQAPVVGRTVEGFVMPSINDCRQVVEGGYQCFDSFMNLVAKDVATRSAVDVDAKSYEDHFSEVLNALDTCIKRINNEYSDLKGLPEVDEYLQSLETWKRQASAHGSKQLALL